MEILPYMGIPEFESRTSVLETEMIPFHHIPLVPSPEVASRLTGLQPVVLLLHHNGITQSAGFEPARPYGLSVSSGADLPTLSRLHCITL